MPFDDVAKLVTSGMQYIQCSLSSSDVPSRSSSILAELVSQFAHSTVSTPLRGWFALVGFTRAEGMYHVLET